MNERIKELAASAYLYAREVQSVNDDDADKYYLDFQAKFAELLIQECADIALKSGSVHNKSEQAKAEAERIYHKINELFGVE